MSEGRIARRCIDVRVEDAVCRVMGDVSEGVGEYIRFALGECFEYLKGGNAALAVKKRAEIFRFWAKRGIEKTKICALRSKKIERQALFGSRLQTGRQSEE